MKINPVIFREYDIRGTVDTELTPEFARILGRAYATLAIENNMNRIGIGYD
jgi:phosphomannomutase/phosphoglucomutase